jgi:hypothetical protein
VLQFALARGNPSFERLLTGTQFTCFTGTKIHILTLILVYMYPHTAVYLSSYYYECVLILLYMRLLTVPGTFINQFAMDEFYYAVYSLYEYKTTNSDTASSQCLGPSSISLLWTSLRTTFVSPPPTARCAPLLRLYSGSIQALLRLY